MPKTKSRRFTEQERAAILADMKGNGLTQVAAAKKHGVSAVTIWQWRKAARSTRRAPTARARRSSRSDGSLDGLLRTQVRERIQQLLPKVVREEVARYVQRVLARKRSK